MIERVLILGPRKPPGSQKAPKPAKPVQTPDSSSEERAIESKDTLIYQTPQIAQSLGLLEPLFGTGKRAPSPDSALTVLAKCSDSWPLACSFSKLAECDTAIADRLSLLLR